MLSVFDKGRADPCPAPFNMARYVLDAGRSCPDKVALSVLSQTTQTLYTYDQITQAILGIARGFQDLGLRAGDRILLRLGNRPETPFVYLAALAVDMVPVPTSPMLTEPEVQRVLDLLTPALVVHEAPVPCPPCNTRVDIADIQAMKTYPAADFVLGDPNRPAYVVLTSGTSGQPRAVEHAHRAIWARRMMHRGWYDLTADDRVLHAGAFNWTYTMGTGLMDPWSVGATALIPADGTPPEALRGMILTAEPTLFAAAPGVFRKVLKDPAPITAPKLRHGLSAGEKLPATVRAAWKTTTGTQVHEAFGMSECSTFVSGSPENPAIGDATGQPQPGRHVAILGDDGTPVARGTAGTIAVHTSDPGLMRGYLLAPNTQAEPVHTEWFVTGDQGVMTENDQIIYLGRNDDMMNAGGYRVSPLEVEAALASAPGITTLAVTDVAVKDGVRVIMAFYTAPKRLDSQILHDFATSCVAPYKRPREYVYVDALPVGPNGKLLRKDLHRLWRPHDQA